MPSTTPVQKPANVSTAVLGALQSYYRDVANHKTLLIPLEQCRLQRTLVFRAVGWVCLNWRFVHSA